MSSSINLEDFRIPLEELKRATKNFKHIEYGCSCNGKLSDRWQNREAFIKRFDKKGYESDEVEIVSQLHHENITSFIGYCDEDDDWIYMVYEYFTDNNLYDILFGDLDGDVIGWAYRLEICIRVAKVLKYLHSDLGEHGSVVHGDVKCENILLDHDNLELIKVSGFKYSKLVPLNQPHQLHYCPKKLFEKYHTDPIYKETNLLGTVSDVYSFGVLMFEILHGTRRRDGRCGRLESIERLIFLARGGYDDGPYKLVDPIISGIVDHRSLQIFTTLAYKCISFDIKERPRMDEIIKTIEKALDIHNNGGAFENALRTIEKFEIPLEDIRKAIGAEDFDEKIPSRYRMMTHRGKLVDNCNDREAFFKHWTSEGTIDRDSDSIMKELLLISSFHHENITPFIGYYADDDAIIIALEYAVNGSLYRNLEYQYMGSYLTWAQRLKICLGAARGLKYLHSGIAIGEDRVIHGDFNCKYILLYGNLEAKICGFGKSILVPRNHRDTNVHRDVAQGDKYYMDPVYRESRIPRVESNVYSFGVVLFELLTGVLACNHPVEDERISMINWVRQHYNDEIEKLIDDRIRDEIDARSLHTFKDIAYKCISFNMKERPSMNQVVNRLEEALYIQTHGAASTIAPKNQTLEDFRIPLKEINLAIGEKRKEAWIGEGGFGVVYKGQPSEHWQNRTVAIKCLHPKSYQGEFEFRNELNMIFNFSHENIIPFIGYCDEGNEKIIIYEFASNGSLDCHLTDKNKRRFLTWEHRLKICLGAARGLDYLHSGLGEDNRVIHRDVKSGNILLDHNFVAKVCDFGLSKSGPINQQNTQVYTNAAGTNFYMDPVYHEGGILRKESDVYSFGVVMFELLSGMLAYNRRRLEDGKPKPLINIVRRYYDHKPDFIIDPLISGEIDNRSFNAYKEVAFQCISFNSKERPTMEMIVDRVEEALELQVTNRGDLKQEVTES